MPSAIKWAIALMAGCLVIYAGWRAPWVLTTFFILNCFVLIIVVLLQSGKAADLAGAFGGAGSQTAFGPRGAANVLSRATTWCAIMFMACSLALVLRQDKTVSTGSSILENVSKPAPQKAAPAPSQQPTTQPAAPQSSPQPAAPQGGAQNPPVTQQAPQQPPAQAPGGSAKPAAGGSTQNPPPSSQPTPPPQKKP